MDWFCWENRLESLVCTHPLNQDWDLRPQPWMENHQNQQKFLFFSGQRWPMQACQATNMMTCHPEIMVCDTAFLLFLPATAGI
jgi:hypothetical protein